MSFRRHCRHRDLTFGFILTSFILFLKYWLENELQNMTCIKKYRKSSTARTRLSTLHIYKRLVVAYIFLRYFDFHNLLNWKQFSFLNWKVDVCVHRSCQSKARVVHNHCFWWPNFTELVTQLNLTQFDSI